MLEYFLLFIFPSQLMAFCYIFSFLREHADSISLLHTLYLKSQGNRNVSFGSEKIRSSLRVHSFFITFFTILFECTYVFILT